MGKHYFNTTHESGAKLKSYETQAASQEDLILSHFKSSPGMMYTPSEIQTLILPNSPVTSVRRAMSNLTKKGLLRKTSHKIEGPYGHPEHLWTVEQNDD